MADILMPGAAGGAPISHPSVPTGWPCTLSHHLRRPVPAAETLLTPTAGNAGREKDLTPVVR